MSVTMTLDPRTMPDGVVLVLSVRYENQTSDKVWTYAALKAGGRWFLTGANTPTDAGWAAVERWLERDNREMVRVEILTQSRSIWPVPVDAASPDPIIVPEETEPEEPYYGDDSPGSKIDTPQA